MPLVIAHRGASAEEVENSVAAFRRAVKEGADGVELDVHATADGGLVVRHDDMLAGQRIARMTLSEVLLHTLANGEPIPTLAEGLATLGSSTIAFIEVKSLAAAHDDRFLATLDAAPVPSHCHVHAFDHRVVRRLKSRRPGLTCGVLSTSYPVRPLAQLEDAGATELWQLESLIDEGLVEAVHHAGDRLYAWTVDDTARMKALAELGVDGVCTNRPALARAVLG
ncbi:MAG: glycerophosphodiester phosphodiesterase [Gemmatimonadetes bacterium]|nr:glycerophosphodiester phosphodiesterase [Gemmatimonadota bacterium]